MAGNVVKRPVRGRRARWHARLADDELGSVGLLVACAVGVISGLATVNPGVGISAGIGVAILDVAGRRIVRRMLRPPGEYVRRIADEPGRADLATARTAVKRTDQAWPWLGVLADEQPTTALAEALWQLAGELRHRADLRDAADSAGQLLTDLPPDDPARAEVELRQSELAIAMARVQDSITARLDRLERLADACARQVIAQTTRSRLTDLHQRADGLLAASAAESAAATGEDPAAELTERTEAVLTAYRELLAE